MRDVVIGTAYGQMPGYLAAPGGAGPWPGVVVVHDFAGMSHDLRNQADWLAGEGYLAAAPDLYYWGSRLRCLWTIMREVTAGKGRTVADIDAARDWLSAREDCTGRIGVLGFCMGGGYALALATGHGYAASSTNYGGGRRTRPGRHGRETQFNATHEPIRRGLMSWVCSLRALDHLCAFATSGSAS